MKLVQSRGNTLVACRQVKIRPGAGIAVLLLGLGLLMGCGYSPPEMVGTLNAQIEPAVTATPYPAPVEAKPDCGWHSDVRAFVDENANKRWDAAEPPLPGVTFYADDIFNNESKVAGATTGEDGRTTLIVFIYDCRRVELEIYAQVPEGYVLTTPERIDMRDIGSGEPFMFGFRRIRPSPVPSAVPGMPDTGRPDGAKSIKSTTARGRESSLKAGVNSINARLSRPLRRQSASAYKAHVS
jgi:hypothetical protein